MDSIIFYLFNYIIKNKEQFKMNKISNDKIEKKKSNEKIQQKPNIKNETKKKQNKKVWSSQACGSGWPGMPRP